MRCLSVATRERTVASLNVQMTLYAKHFHKGLTTNPLCKNVLR